MALHFAVSVTELEEALPKIVSIAGRSIGIIKSNGEVYAVRNVCPHKRAPVCKGLVKGTMLPSDPGEFVFGLKNEILQCPWHGWEFDLRSGETICQNSSKKLTFYPVKIEDDTVYVEI